jgi:hypothetical protein
VAKDKVIPPPLGWRGNVREYWPVYLVLAFAIGLLVAVSCYVLYTQNEPIWIVITGTVTSSCEDSVTFENLEIYTGFDTPKARSIIESFRTGDTHTFCLRPYNDGFHIGLSYGVSLGYEKGKLWMTRSMFADQPPEN